MPRHKDVAWNLVQLGHDRADTKVAYRAYDNFVIMALLMDIRDELQQLNSLLQCTNFRGIPATLRTISRHTATPRRPKKDAV